MGCCALNSAHADIEFQKPDLRAPLRVNAEAAECWRVGVYEVWHVSGNVKLSQGTTVVHAHEAALWVEKAGELSEPTKVIAYLEGEDGAPTRVEYFSAPGDAEPTARQLSPTYFDRYYTLGGVDWRTPPPVVEPQQKAAIVERGFARFTKPEPAPLAPPPTAAPIAKRPTQHDPALAPAQFGAPMVGGTFAPPPAATPAGANFRRVQLFTTGGSTQLDARKLPNGESVGILSGGANIIVTGVSAPGIAPEFGPIDTLDLTFDRAVIWTRDAGALTGGVVQQNTETPFEVYLEGNIVFRQGNRTIYAERMYYDVRQRTGIILDAEVLTPLPSTDSFEYRGLVRLKAEAIRQLDDSRFVATNALVTPSRLEVPSFHLGADTIEFTDIQQPRINPATGLPDIDPATGAAEFDNERLATSRDNKVFIDSIPVFYWPTISTNLEEPTFYVDNFRIRNDSIFGFQTLLDLDNYQLLGARHPPGVKWTTDIDYLSDRGLGLGTKYRYDVQQFAGATGPAYGFLDLWGISDSGTDNLGLLRRDIEPERDLRGRAFWNHRQNVQDGLLEGWIAQAEVGFVSDRTFLEQYYEQDWDIGKDQSTGVRLRRLMNNQSLSIEANGQVNPFFSETQWLPRLDHYLLGQELAGDSLTWFAHTNVGYANFNPATNPSNATLNGQFELFPWEQDSAGGRTRARGERFATRHELDFPIDAAPFKVVPYVLGEAAHWGDDLDGDTLDRLYGQIGVRSSIPFWSVNPNVRDPLFNLNGLAHKVVFEAEAFYADASRNFDELPLYDEIEDNSIEEFRRRYFFSPFGGQLAGGAYDPVAAPSTIDPRFDPRVYLLRSGVQSWVTSPTTELADDLSLARVGMRHRLQTKRGAPGQEHIVDWLTFDTHLTYFPDSSRDNFGQDFGLLDYDVQWHLGDRFSIVSDGFADVFNDGLRMVSGGVVLNRPTRGNAYLGYRAIRGPLSADLLIGTINYRLSPKWIASGSTVFDFSEAGNIGQSFAFSRIGESLIVTVGANVDTSKNNVGFNFLIEPRFLPRLRTTRTTGIDIPPAGAYGLE